MQERVDLRDVFSLCDSDGSQVLDYRELRRALQGLGFSVSVGETKRLIKDVDSGRGMINFDEFCDLVEKLGSRESSARREILEGFVHFDVQRQGKITLQDLKTICRETGEYIPEADLRQMISAADLTGSGDVTVDEFVNVMQQTVLFRRAMSI